MRKGLFLLFALLVITTSFNQSSATIIIPVAAKATEPDPATVKAAIAALKALPRKERKERIREVKQEMKAYKLARKAHKEPSTNTLLEVILAILLPPLAVYLHEGEINNKFWISLLLTIIFWIPGVIYALIVVLGDS